MEYRLKKGKQDWDLGPPCEVVQIVHCTRECVNSEWWGGTHNHLPHYSPDSVLLSLGLPRENTF